MRIRRLTPAVLAAVLAACGSDSSSTELPDAAVGTYDKQAAVGESRSANCGGTIGTIVNGVLYLSADHTWTKADVNTTPSGSFVCGFVGGTWVRDNATTLTLAPGLPGLDPVSATVVGNGLTLQFPTPVAYTRRP